MTDPVNPDLNRLRRRLQESKATSAEGQDLLDDPDGAALIQKARDMLDQALAEGDREIALRVARILEGLLNHEGEVRRTQHESDRALRQAINVILDALGNPPESSER
ncbi:MAG: hypothetical protein QOG53_3517 [Frankiales bacterium]|nr:hypothetical protein [Frankiales bacterium]